MLQLSVDLTTPTGLIAIGLLALLLSIWAWWCIRRGRTALLLIPALLVAAGCAFYWAATVGIDEDEAEHLHCAWLLANGQIPFVDFWQHHLPTLWVALAPLMKFLPASSAIYIASRAMMVLMFLLLLVLGWLVARELWGERADRRIYLLVAFSASIQWQFAWLRPDLPMLLGLLAGLYFTLRLAKGSDLAALFAGLTIAIGLSFSVKQYPMALLPLLVIFSAVKKSYLPRIALYLLGFAAGLTPLIVYLLVNGILPEFIYWTGSFNSTRTIMAADFPVAVSAASIVGWLLLLGRYHKQPDKTSLAGLSALVLTLFASLFSTSLVFKHYLNFWLVLCSILACGIPLRKLTDFWDLKLKSKSALIGTALTLLILPGLIEIQGHELTGFDRDRRQVQEILDLTRNKTCLVFTPQHPIFVQDATRLYTRWQYRLTKGTAADRQLVADNLGRNSLEDILTKRPALITHDIWGMELFEALEDKGLLDRDLKDRLHDFLADQYGLIQIGNDTYYQAGELETE